MAEMARELHSACEGPSTCMLKGCAVMCKVREYSGTIFDELVHDANKTLQILYSEQRALAEISILRSPPRTLPPLPPPLPQRLVRRLGSLRKLSSSKSNARTLASTRSLVSKRLLLAVLLVRLPLLTWNMRRLLPTLKDCNRALVLMLLVANTLAWYMRTTTRLTRMVTCHLRKMSLIRSSLLM